jgi:hypothetical protein
MPSQSITVLNAPIAICFCGGYWWAWSEVLDTAENHCPASAQPASGFKLQNCGHYANIYPMFLLIWIIADATLRARYPT